MLFLLFLVGFIKQVSFFYLKNNQDIHEQQDDGSIHDLGGGELFSFPQQNHTQIRWQLERNALFSM